MWEFANETKKRKIFDLNCLKSNKKFQFTQVSLQQLKKMRDQIGCQIHQGKIIHYKVCGEFFNAQEFNVATIEDDLENQLMNTNNLFFDSIGSLSEEKKIGPDHQIYITDKINTIFIKNKIESYRRKRNLYRKCKIL